MLTITPGQTPHPLKRRVPLRDYEARQAQAQEMERVAQLRNLDGTSRDLDPREGFTRSEEPVDGAGDGWRRAGWFKETPSESVEKPYLEYGVASTLYWGESGTFHAEINGWHDPSSGIWFVSRDVNGPLGPQREEITLNCADLGSSYKEVWLLSDR